MQTAIENGRCMKMRLDFGEKQKSLHPTWHNFRRDFKEKFSKNAIQCDMTRQWSAHHHMSAIQRTKTHVEEDAGQHGKRHELQDAHRREGDQHENADAEC